VTDFLNDMQSWAFLIPIFVATLAWLLNEASKRRWERHRGKEESYRELLTNLRGFYGSAPDRAMQREFLNQVNLCWLYSPDSVIQAAYNLLDSIYGVEDPDRPNKVLAGELFVAVRNDLMGSRFWRRTKLTGADFGHFSPIAGE
jgi:hypothetical protein